MDQTTPPTNVDSAPVVPEMGNPLSVAPTISPDLATETASTSSQEIAAPNIQPLTSDTATAPQTISTESVSATATPQTDQQPSGTEPLSQTVVPTVDQPSAQASVPIESKEEAQTVVPPTPMPVDIAMPQNTGSAPVAPPAKSTKLGLAIGITLLIALMVGGSVYYYFFMYTKEAVAVITTPTPTATTTPPQIIETPTPQIPVLPPVDIASQILDEANANTDDEALSASSTDEFVAESNAK